MSTSSSASQQNRFRFSVFLIALFLALVCTPSAFAQSGSVTPAPQWFDIASDKPLVFSGTQFPKIESQFPPLIENIIGPYETQLAYFDRDGKPTDAATQPGRYGCVLTLKGRSGTMIRRFVTLFRSRRDPQWQVAPLDITVALPDALGVHPGVQLEQARHMNEYLKQSLLGSVRTDQKFAALMARLYETTPGGGEHGFTNDAAAADRAYWLGVRKALKQTRPAVVIDELETSDKAPKLRKGSDLQARYPQGTSKALDDACFKWADETGVGLSACAASSNSVFFFQSYTAGDGPAINAATQFDIGPLTQIITGTLVMMLAEQNVIALDDPVGKHLPAMNQGKAAEVTIADLLHHRSGLSSNWSQIDNPTDLDFIAAAALSTRPSNVGVEPTRANYDLLGLLIESITGKSLAAVVDEQFASHLSLRNTSMSAGGGGASMSAADLAKLGQMLLNNGGFDGKALMSEEQCVELIGALGLRSLEAGPLSGPTFGMATDSGATLVVDPHRRTVIAVGRPTRVADDADYLLVVTRLLASKPPLAEFSE